VKPTSSRGRLFSLRSIREEKGNRIANCMQHLENACTNEAYGKSPVSLIIDAMVSAGRIVLQAVNSKQEARRVRTVAALVALRNMRRI